VSFVEWPTFIAVSSVLLQNQREQRQLAALAAIVRAQNENDVFDAHDNDQRPDDQRQYTVDITRISLESVLFLEALTERVQRARADVAVNDANCEDCEAGETSAGGIALWMVSDVSNPLAVTGPTTSSAQS